MKHISRCPQQSRLEENENEEDDGPKMRVVVDNSYICQYCPARFKSYYQLKTHLVKHKSQQVGCSGHCWVDQCFQLSAQRRKSALFSIVGKFRPEFRPESAEIPSEKTFF